MSDICKQKSHRGLDSFLQKGWPQGVRRLRRHSGRRAPGRDRQPIGIESLEERTLLSVSLEGIPLWIEQGPGTITHGHSEGIPGEPQAGATNIALPDPTDYERMFVASVNGGIWRTNDAMAPEPHWVPPTDQMEHGPGFDHRRRGERRDRRR